MEFYQSFYVTSDDWDDIYELGRDCVNNIAGKVILDFDSPAYYNGEYGITDHNSDAHFMDMDEVEELIKVTFYF